MDNMWMHAMCYTNDMRMHLMHLTLWTWSHKCRHNMNVMHICAPKGTYAHDMVKMQHTYAKYTINLYHKMYVWALTGLYSYNVINNDEFEN